MSQTPQHRPVDQGGPDDDGAEDLIDAVGDSLDRGMVPLRVFNDQRIHRRELERIFGRSWVFIGHESELPDPGDYAIRYIANDPYIFTRDESGEINVLFNSCRHHGTELCRAEQGNTSHFRCPYHGWTFSNSGALVGVPEKGKAFPDLEPEEWGLLEPRVDTYRGLVFASIAEDGPSLDDHLGSFTWYLDMHLGLTDKGMEVIGEPHRWEVDVDWKSGADNFAGDSYHTQVTHQSLFEVGVVRSDRVGTNASNIGGFSHYHVTHCDGHSTSIKLFDDSGTAHFWGYPDEVKQNFRPGDLSDEQFDIAGRLINTTGNIFPNLSLIHINATDDPDKDPASYLSLRKWRPLDPGRMQIWSWVLVPSEAPQEYKERAYKVAVSTFSPSGNFEQDDMAAWRGISKAARSEFTRRRNVELNYEMGLQPDAEVSELTDWPGPGRTFDGNLEEGVQRTFHDSWYEAMASEGR